GIENAWPEPRSPNCRRTGAISSRIIVLNASCAFIGAKTSAGLRKNGRAGELRADARDDLLGEERHALHDLPLRHVRELEDDVHPAAAGVAGPADERLGHS